jgi:hypothetical protein
MATLSKVGNPASRLFLTKIGKEYDKKRTYKVFDTRRDSPTILRFFNDECVYCGTTLCLTKNAPNKMVKDHLIPINMTTYGLHSWGNIVPACNTCNSDRREEDWQVFLARTVGSLKMYLVREAKINSYVCFYNYTPNTALIQLEVQSIQSQTKAFVDNLCTSRVNAIKGSI